MVHSKGRRGIVEVRGKRKTERERRKGVEGEWDYGETFGHLATLLTFGQLRLVINELADRKCPSLGEESPPRARLSRIRLLFPLANALYMQIRPTGPSACPLSRVSSASTYSRVCVYVHICIYARICVCIYENAYYRGYVCGARVVRSPALYK